MAYFLSSCSHPSTVCGVVYTDGKVSLPPPHTPDFDFGLGPARARRELDAESGGAWHLRCHESTRQNLSKLAELKVTLLKRIQGNPDHSGLDRVELEEVQS